MCDSIFQGKKAPEYIALRKAVKDKDLSMAHAAIWLLFQKLGLEDLAEITKELS